MTVYRWADKDTDFAKVLQKAREQSYFIIQRQYDDLKRRMTGSTRSERHKLRALEWELEKRQRVLANNRLERQKRRR